MVATSNNCKAVLFICIAYTSTDEIVNAVRKSCEEKDDRIGLLNGVTNGFEWGEKAQKEGLSIKLILRITCIC